MVDLRGRGPAARYYELDVDGEKIRENGTGGWPTADRNAAVYHDIVRDEDLPRETLCPGPRAEATRRAVSREELRRVHPAYRLVSPAAVFCASSAVVVYLWAK
ncbi:hypothetical protein DIPPA_34995 [Diplonema papillatum]|nr:hypothetical protein DIPPA_34995 [Diplonema papillatum]